MTIDANPYIRQATYHLASGGVIAYPTEAVWGLGCDPNNESAIAPVLNLKHRQAQKGLILVASCIEQFDFLLHDLPLSKYQQLEQSWPGPYTWLVPHQGLISPLIHGQFDTVALRVSTHPVIRALCDQFGGPIVSTSANPQGKSPAHEQWRARNYFGNKLYYCPGSIGRSANPSKITHLMTGDIIRPA